MRIEIPHRSRGIACQRERTVVRNYRGPGITAKVNNWPHLLPKIFSLPVIGIDLVTNLSNFQDMTLFIRLKSGAIDSRNSIISDDGLLKYNTAVE